MLQWKEIKGKKTISCWRFTRYALHRMYACVCTFHAFTPSFGALMSSLKWLACPLANELATLSTVHMRNVLVSRSRSLFSFVCLLVLHEIFPFWCFVISIFHAMPHAGGSTMWFIWIAHCNFYYTPHTRFLSLRALNWVVVSLLHAYSQFTKNSVAHSIHFEWILSWVRSKNCFNWKALCSELKTHR